MGAGRAAARRGPPLPAKAGATGLEVGPRVVHSEKRFAHCFSSIRDAKGERFPPSSLRGGGHEGRCCCFPLPCFFLFCVGSRAQSSGPVALPPFGDTAIAMIRAAAPKEKDWSGRAIPDQMESPPTSSKARPVTAPGANGIGALEVPSRRSHHVGPSRMTAAGTASSAPPETSHLGVPSKPVHAEQDEWQEGLRARDLSFFLRRQQASPPIGGPWNGPPEAGPRTAICRRCAPPRKDRSDPRKPIPGPGEGAELIPR